MDLFIPWFLVHLVYSISPSTGASSKSVHCFQCSSYLSAWCNEPFDRSSPVGGRTCRKPTNSTKYASVNVMRNMFMVLGNIFPPTNYGYERYVGFESVSNHYFPDRRRRHTDGDAVKAEVAVKNASSHREVRQYPFPPRPMTDGSNFGCFKIVITSPHGELRVFRGCFEPKKYDVCTIALEYSKAADERIVSCDTCLTGRCNHSARQRGVEAITLTTALIACFLC